MHKLVRSASLHCLPLVHAAAQPDGDTDWDAVIDAEMARRKLLEDTPIPSITEEAVVFDTSEIPWWAWVRRFHLPEVSRPGAGAGAGRDKAVEALGLVEGDD